MRKTEMRSVSGFDRILLKDVGDVFITQGEVESLQVEAEEEMLPRIKTEVVEGRLVLSLKGDWLDRISLGLGQLSQGAIRYNLQVKQLVNMDVPGAGRVYAASLKSPNLAVRLSGVGSIELGGVDTGALTVELSGAGKIELQGTAESQEVHMSGAGSYQGLRLETKRGNVHVSGVGNALVNVKDELDVHMSGLGSVQYQGEPRLHTNISGLGRLTKV